MKLVAIDPGHGGKFPGATNGKWQEKDFNLATAWAIFHYLKGKDIHCLLTRYNDRELGDKLITDLRRRTDIANRARADLFVSIHADSTGEKYRKIARGFSTYFMPESRKGNRVGVKIIGSMERQLPNRRNRGMGTKRFYVLRETAMPAVLVECGFISHPEESEWLFGNIEIIAEAIGDGIIRALEVLC